MMTQWKKPSGWQDGVELLVVIWVFVSPVVLRFFAYNAETLTAMSVAAVATLTILLGIAKQQPWEEWFNLSLAVFLAASPWIFGYWTSAGATANAVISGLVLATFAILSMIDEYAQMRQFGGGPKTHGPAG
jgi:hypothetical protein